MSQHLFATTATLPDGTTCNAQVLMGWDRPLQGYFCVIENLDDSSDDCYLYSNLYETPDKAHPQDLDHFLAQLTRFKITLPARMLAEVRADRVENAGNKVVRHG
jgi:hypothetical protein